MSRQTKYIFVTGGVLSGLGKGITAASIANLLKARGQKVNLQKCDPYLNADAGLLNPREHGECFVTKDGAETDLDLGHYERFIDEELTQTSSLMNGRVFRKVLEDERNGKFGGQTAQIVPHVTNTIQDYIREAGQGFDVHIVEIGGTVGDLEAMTFIEAIREFSQEIGRQNCLFVHVVYMPYLGASKETKTKPAQNAVRELRSLGIMPDIIAARSEHPVNGNIRHKLSQFCGVDEDSIALLPNAKSIYQVPLTLEESGVADVVVRKLDLQARKADLKEWSELNKRSLRSYDKSVNVGIVAKYMDNEDTYLSVFEALRAASWWNDVNVNIKWLDAEEVEASDDLQSLFKDIDGIVVPGGFGGRGLEGKIKASQYALKHDLPYLGLCLGLQMAVIAAARNAGLTDATSAEIDATAAHQVINTMVGQEGMENTGGTMRLGDYPCKIAEDSLAAKVYGATEITERHRHRLECNNYYRDQYEKWGIRAAGTSPDGNLVEMIEAINHPFFLASQFHPEFKSRPNHPHPMFNGFIVALKKSAK